MSKFVFVSLTTPAVPKKGSDTTHNLFYKYVNLKEKLVFDNIAYCISKTHEANFHSALNRAQHKIIIFKMWFCLVTLVPFTQSDRLYVFDSTLNDATQ